MRGTATADSVAAIFAECLGAVLFPLDAIEAIQDSICRFGVLGGLNWSLLLLILHRQRILFHLGCQIQGER